MILHVDEKYVFEGFHDVIARKNEIIEASMILYEDEKFVFEGFHDVIARKNEIIESLSWMIINKINGFERVRLFDAYHS